MRFFLSARPRFPRDASPERKHGGFGFDFARRGRSHLRARRAQDVLVRGDRQGRDLREHELVLEEAPFARSALAFLEPRLDEVQHRLGHDGALQPELGDLGPVQAVVLEDGDVHHGGEHQRQRRGAREPALGLHQEHREGHHPDDEHDDREVEPEGIGVAVHVVSSYLKTGGLETSPVPPRVGERTRRPRARVRVAPHATRAKRRAETRTGWPPRTRARVSCVAGPVEKPFIRRFDTRRRERSTVRFPSRALASTHRAVPRFWRLRKTRERFSSHPATRTSRTRLRPFAATRVATSERRRNTEKKD